MAWTAPMTATLNQTFTSAQWNTHIRDNFNETEAAKATTQGRYFVSTGSNSIAERGMWVRYNNTSQSTTSTSYTDLSTSGPSVGATTGTSAVVFWNCGAGNATGAAQSWVSVSVSSATTVAASDTWATMVDGLDAGSSTDDMVRMGGFHRFTGLTAGYNTFKMQYRVSGGTGWFNNRVLMVLPF